MSSRTPAASAKTGSGRKYVRRNVILALLLLVIIVAGGGAYYLALPRDKAAQPAATEQTATDEAPPSDITYRLADVTAGSKAYRLQVAETTQQQSLGLGKRKTIGGDGMVFVYSKPQKLCFWMKDMNFAIDMLWLDAAKQVVKLEPQVSPDTYPRVTYCAEAQYVVELGSGQAQQAGISVGSKLDISL